jgi:hypothetical protein
MFGYGIGSLATRNLRLGIFSTLIEGAMGAIPTKPDVPSQPFVNPGDVQQSITQGNQAVLGDLQSLGREVDAYQLQQRAKALGTIPGYANITEGGSNLLQSQLAGQLSPDVASAVGRRSNARSVAGGYGGSGMADFADLRNYGLTSMDVQRQGQAAAPGWLGTLANLQLPPEFNVQSGFVTPAQGLAVQQFNEESRYGQQWLQNQLDSLPDPYTAQLASDLGGMADYGASMGTLGIYGDMGYGSRGGNMTMARLNSIYGGGGGGMGGGGGGGGNDFGGELMAGAGAGGSSYGGY